MLPIAGNKIGQAAIYLVHLGPLNNFRGYQLNRAPPSGELPLIRGSKLPREICRLTTPGNPTWWPQLDQGKNQ